MLTPTRRCWITTGEEPTSLHTEISLLLKTTASSTEEVPSKQLLAPFHTYFLPNISIAEEIALEEGSLYLPHLPTTLSAKS